MRNTMTGAQVQQVIVTTLDVRGDGKTTPFRRLTQYWTFEGKLLAEVDPDAAGHFRRARALYAEPLLEALRLCARALQEPSTGDPKALRDQALELVDKLVREYAAGAVADGHEHS